MMELENYEESEYERLIPQKDMLSLLIRYGEFYLEYDFKRQSNMFFEMAANITEDETKVILAHADGLYEKHYLQEAADLYNRYMSLMRNEGMDSKIPGRVREFVRSENYGQSLHQKLFGCYLENYPAAPIEDQYYYEEDDYLIINNQIYSSLWGSSDWLLYGNSFYYDDGDPDIYYGLLGCVARMVGEQARKGRLSDFMELTGIKPCYTESEEFTYVNGKIIEWARKNLIPDTEMRLLNFSSQTLYNTLLRDAVRRKALGYAFLTNYHSLEDEAYNYQERMYDEYFYGFDYLHDRFYEIASYNESEDIDSWELVIDAGFWLRRQIDGSLNECWELVSEILSRYDSGFLDFELWEVWEYYGDDYYEEDYYEEEMEGEY